MKVPFDARLRQPRVLVMDGATGTELGRRGVNLASPSWTARAIIDQPDLLREVHRDYVLAGADLVTANTFRTHARSLKPIGLADRAAELTLRAVEIAREAAGETRYVAGSVAPLEDCYSPQLTPSFKELEREHETMAEHLTHAGVDIILIETQVTIREAVIAARAARRTGLPFCVSFTCHQTGDILSGESLAEGFTALLESEPAALLVNCLPAEEVLPTLQSVRRVVGGTPLGAYANTGRLLPTGIWEATAGVEPAVYAVLARRWVESGIALIGGCCGTTADHISAISQML